MLRITANHAQIKLNSFILIKVKNYKKKLLIKNYRSLKRKMILNSNKVNLSRNLLFIKKWNLNKISISTNSHKDSIKSHPSTDLDKEINH